MKFGILKHILSYEDPPDLVRLYMNMHNLLIWFGYKMYWDNSVTWILFGAIKNDQAVYT